MSILASDRRMPVGPRGPKYHPGKRASQRVIQDPSRDGTLEYVLGVWEAMDTPVSLSCFILASNGEFEQLVRKGIDPLSYNTPLDFFLDLQSVKLVSKYPFFETGIDRRAAAYEKFLQAEDSCKRNNALFRDPSSVLNSQGRVSEIIFSAQRKIATILGEVPPFERMDFSFGPGAAYGVRGDTSVFNKVTSTLECNYALTDRLQEFLEEFPGWIPLGVHEVRLVPGSQLTFVPKDAKIDRPICIEPLLSGLMQKGTGSWIRKRLKRHGIDLSDQGVNQGLAGRAYAESLATVDFSSASDTISYALVLNLLPIDWFEFLELSRSPRYEHDGVWTNFEKFSSMGNAYTFELETLIFYAIACSCCESLGIDYMTGENLSVYGDDVIIPQACFDLFAEVTEACGFTINLEKSFKNGPFFESCGHDFFKGTFVRPFQLKKRLNKLLPVFYAANTLVRLSSRLPQGREGQRGSVRKRLSSVHHEFIVCYVPERSRFRGPEDHGDGHLVSTMDSCLPSRHRYFDAWCYETCVERPINIPIVFSPMGYALYGTRVVLPEYIPVFGKESESTNKGSSYAIRGRTRVMKIKTLSHAMWPEYLIHDGWYHSLN